jgi:hypothetical protein
MWEILVDVLLIVAEVTKQVAMEIEEETKED